ncbi:hypothetical protein, variant [Verruconis gallopava]|uniref:Zn(2)-C6 fungal-type domain-containing protein n=1 Tax=Verruconis gallopava TaxID=253628 RepID=A0A0D2BAU6_9PEZI|nr:uncharacterized protein PV09_01328 [Verruconis gallopava]XP_016218294.1 hypothetical protein, variant [Verruconis gallopava]KIW08424.1 hypothetical protein PV09_01328 [Verruconis gallopava]KIW08425.1 hypothetical protein, variant [Verruconis gallopava]
MEAPSSPPDRVVKRRNKKGSACTYCRQLKFKCDAAERFPLPCSRCANSKSGRRCTIDPSFRRTANKQRLDSLEKELQQVREELRQKQVSPSTHTTSPSVLDPAPVEHNAGIANGTPDNLDAAVHSQQDISTELVHGVELLPNVVLSLIEEFYARLHSHFPILPDQPTFLSRYNFNKLLLWTVLAIASRESSQHSALYSSLVDPVRRLAGDLYASQSRSFETVQALLLLCVWPFPFQQTINDPSPMYIALASQIAYQLGLHRPGFRADFTENNLPQADPGELARKKVWYGCCIVNQFVTAKLGTPATIKPGHAVLSELAQGTLSVVPEPLISQLHLAYLANKAQTALGDDDYSQSGIMPNCLTAVRAFEAEAAQLRERFKHKWGTETQLLYLSHLQHLYSFALDASSMRGDVSQVDVEIDLLYAKAYDVALQSCRAAAAATGSNNCWPVFVKYSVMYGLLFAIPLANIEPLGSSQRKQLIDAIRDGLVVMRSWSMYEKDHFSRVSGHIDWLLHKLEDADRGRALSTVTISGNSTTEAANGGKKKRLKFSVKSRMATNIMYETIWTAKYGAKAEEQARSNIFPTPTVSQALPASQLEIPALNGTLDNFVFTDGWENSGFLDIFADWQSLVGGT